MCRSRYKNYCCPGWTKKPETGLCVIRKYIERRTRGPIIIMPPTVIGRDLTSLGMHSILAFIIETVREEHRSARAFATNNCVAQLGVHATRPIENYFNGPLQRFLFIFLLSSHDGSWHDWYRSRVRRNSLLISEGRSWKRSILVSIREIYIRKRDVECSIECGIYIEIRKFLLAICVRRCGPLGRCIRPNICLCEGGTVASSCTSSQTKGCAVISRLFEIRAFSKRLLGQYTSIACCSYAYVWNW